MENVYAVYHENNGCMNVIANSEEEAREQFYRSIESCIGHHLKICGCYGEKKPMDRSKIVQITKVEMVGMIDDKG